MSVDRVTPLTSMMHVPRESGHCAESCIPTLCLPFALGRGAVSRETSTRAWHEARSSSLRRTDRGTKTGYGLSILDDAHRRRLADPVKESALSRDAAVRFTRNLVGPTLARAWCAAA